MEKIIIASGPVIVNDSKVLLDVSGEDNFWKFCGGKTKIDLSLKESAIIRAKEELGIEVNVIDDLPFLMYLKKPGDENIDVLLVHFLSECKGDIHPGESVKEWAWHNLNDLPENLAPNILPALRHFNLMG